MDYKTNGPIHTYHAEEIEGYGFILSKNGIVASCMFQPPAPVANPLTGQVSMQRSPCNTGCPLANIVKTINNGEGYEYIVECNGTRKAFDVTVSFLKDKKETKAGLMIV